MEAGDKVREGQVVVHLRKDYVEPWVDGRIEVLYEDPTMVAVHKPSPLPCHASGRIAATLSSICLAKSIGPSVCYWPIVGRGRFGGRCLEPSLCGRLEAAKTVRTGIGGKTYVARVVGQPTMDRFECINRSVAQGERTDDAPLMPMGIVLIPNSSFRSDWATDDFTGRDSAFRRTHQIRLHLSALGFPIVGDPLYGDPFDVSSELHRSIRLSPGQLCLHAWRLAIDHPVSGQRMTFAAPLPAWFEARA